MMSFNGPARRLDDIDLPIIGKTIGVGEDPIHAILDTETAGSGFDSYRRPKLLFEPHVFYRLLKGAGKMEQLAKASAMNIAYPKWGTLPYPKESYSNMSKAFEIDSNLALQSGSWGLGQIMGFNFSLAGYKSVENMVTEFTFDEEYHLKAMIRFIVSAGLDDELRALDRATTRTEMLLAAQGFARGYNGAGFAKNQYDVKIVNSMIKWRGIKDTPIS